MNGIRLLPAVFLMACSNTYLAPQDADDGAVARAIGEGTAEAYGVLALLRHPSVTESFLDHAVALDSRAASSLAHHRDGPDGVFGTADDDLFETIDEVDAVYYVGNAALDRLAVYADDAGFVPGPTDWVGAWDGVDFTLAEAQDVVWLVNEASLDELDVAVGLNARAAQNIVANGPYRTVAELAAVPYVGTAALTALRDF